MNELIGVSRTHYRMSLTVGAHSARHIRRIVGEYSRLWGMNTERVDAAELAVAELIANVVRHVPDQHCTVLLRKQRSGLRVEVTDSWPKLPAKVDADELDEGGRGLAMLGLITDKWSAELLPEGEEEGKVVWFEIE